MAIMVSGIRIVSDRSDVSAMFVGEGRWVIDPLRGWTLTQSQALGVVQFADAIGDGSYRYPADHPVWAEAQEWVRPLGVSLREAGLLLGLPGAAHDLPSMTDIRPRVIDSTGPRVWSPRALLDVLILNPTKPTRDRRTQCDERSERS